MGDQAVVLVTGSIHRIGKAIAEAMHRRGAKVLIHGRLGSAAESLVSRLNEIRPNSAAFFLGDLREDKACKGLVETCIQSFGRLDVLVNNASVFREKLLGETTAEDSIDQLKTNLIAPLMLIQAAAPHLRVTKGSVLNISDIQTMVRPPKGYSVYIASKAGLDALTRSLALELAPHIRVNSLAIGVVAFPVDWAEDDPRKAEYLARVPLGRPALYSEVAAAAMFLTLENTYITGQVLALDGGASIS